MAGTKKIIIKKLKVTRTKCLDADLSNKKIE